MGRREDLVARLKIEAVRDVAHALGRTAGESDLVGRCAHERGHAAHQIGQALRHVVIDEVHRIVPAHGETILRLDLQGLEKRRAESPGVHVRKTGLDREAVTNAFPIDPGRRRLARRRRGPRRRDHRRGAGREGQKGFPSRRGAGHLEQPGDVDVHLVLPVGPVVSALFAPVVEVMRDAA